MNLKVNMSTRNKVVDVQLETQNFTELENEMLNQVGEPEIALDKQYGGHTVKFRKKIRSNFKIRSKFDGNQDLDTNLTVTYIQQFVDDLQLELEEAMEKVSAEYNLDLIAKEEIIEIKY